MVEVPSSLSQFSYTTTVSAFFGVVWTAIDYSFLVHSLDLLFGNCVCVFSAIFWIATLHRKSSGIWVLNGLLTVVSAFDSMASY